MNKRSLPFSLRTLLVFGGWKGRLGWFQLAVCCFGVMAYNGYRAGEPPLLRLLE